MNSSKTIVLLAFMGLTLAVLIFKFSGQQAIDESLELSAENYFEENKIDIINSTRVKQKIIPLKSENLLDIHDISKRIANKLKEQYGEHIHLLSVQAALFTLRASVLKNYPKQGLMYFNQAVSLAFPEFSASILNIMNAIVLYQNWFESHKSELNAMAEYERHEITWQKRYELFGDDANLIWNERQPMLSHDEQEAIKQIQVLDKAFDMPFDTRLEQLQASIINAYGSNIQMAALTPGLVVTTFLSFESVQKDLHEMPPETRQLKINETREKLGFSENQVFKLAAADQKRQSRWDNGYAYMAERKELMAQLSGHVLEQGLDTLRNKYFEAEAQTFKKEETSGFYRYERPRVYGRN